MRYEQNIEEALRKMATQLWDNKSNVSVVERVSENLRSLADAFGKKMDLDQVAIILSGRVRHGGLTDIMVTQEKIGEGHRDPNVEVWSSGGDP